MELGFLPGIMYHSKCRSLHVYIIHLFSDINVLSIYSKIWKTGLVSSLSTMFMKILIMLAFTRGPSIPASPGIPGFPGGPCEKKVRGDDQKAG